MTGRRFDVTHMSTTIFADRLRLACDEDLGRAYLAAGPDDAADPIQQLVAFNVPNMQQVGGEAVLS